MLSYSKRMGQLKDVRGKSARIAQGKPKEKKEDNMTRRKTWKIGEYCAGGIICAKCNGQAVKIEIKEWETGEVIATNVFGRIHIGNEMDQWLSDYTTFLHADNVVQWAMGILK